MVVHIRQVGRINLRFVDRETGEGREEGATRPDVILRQMSTRPGQVGAMPCSAISATACVRSGVPLANIRQRRDCGGLMQHGVGTMQVYNMKQAQADIESVYSMGLFDDVNILPSPAEDATSDAPKATFSSCGCPTNAPIVST